MTDVQSVLDDPHDELHLNLAWDYEKLGQHDEAAHHLASGRAHLHVLDDDEYGRSIRRGFAESGPG